MVQAQLSQHAEVRANQRGIAGWVIDSVLEHADMETPVGSGCVALRLSRDRIRDARLRRELGARLERLGGVTVICAEDDGSVVTVLHDHGGASGRRYRRLH